MFSFSAESSAVEEGVGASLVVVSVSLSSPRALLLEDLEGGCEAFDSGFDAGLELCSVESSLSLVGASPLAACAYEKGGIAGAAEADIVRISGFCNSVHSTTPSTFNLVQDTTQL